MNTSTLLGDLPCSLAAATVLRSTAIPSVLGSDAAAAAPQERLSCVVLKAMEMIAVENIMLFALSLLVSSGGCLLLMPVSFGVDVVALA